MTIFADSDEFEELRRTAIVNLEAGRQQPTAVATRALNRHLDPYPVGHPRHILTLDEQIAAYRALTLDDVRKFYTDFYGADSGELAVVGDFDDEAIARLAGDLFGGWRTKTPFARMTSLFKDAPPANESLETPDKANAYFGAAMPLNLRQDDPDYPALVMGDYLFGGGFLSSRFPARVRQKEGLSYGAGSGLTADWFDKTGRFSVYAIAAPQNMTRVETAFREELARMLKDGFTATEVSAAKAGWLQERQVERANGITRAMRLYLFEGRTFTWDADLEEKVGALTPDQIVAAMRRHIDPAKISIMKAGDFSKTK